MHRETVGTTNARGHLEIGGCDATELVSRFGTPLVVLDEHLIRWNCRKYLEAFRSFYPSGAAVYAGKAFLCQAMCRIIEQEGLYLDVVSGGELYTAITAGFPPERIFFHGNNKSREEVDLGILHGVGRIVIDNRDELALLQREAKQARTKVKVHLRVTPGVKPSTHHYVQTGQWDSKFGFTLLDNSVIEIMATMSSSPLLLPSGLHCHIGSQIFDGKSYEVAARVMLDLMKKIQKKTGLLLKELNMGGGLGIRYTQEDFPPSILEHMKILAEAVKREARRLSFPLPFLFNEPGRSIVGRAGITLYRVGAVKEIPGIRTYVAVDGGMHENPRVALYEAKYEAVIANKARQEASQRVTVAGKCCESGDILLWDTPLQKAEPGDLLAVFSTGAYHYSMASNYNRLPRPAVVLVREGKTDLIIARESYDDLISLDRIPARLGKKVKGHKTRKSEIRKKEGETKKGRRERRR